MESDCNLIEEFRSDLVEKGEKKKALTQLAIFLLDFLNSNKFNKISNNNSKEIIENVKKLQKEFNKLDQTEFYNEFGLYEKCKRYVSKIIKLIGEINVLNNNYFPLNIKGIEKFLYEIDEFILLSNENKSKYESGTIQSFLNEIGIVFWVKTESFNSVVGVNKFILNLKKFFRIFDVKYDPQISFNHEEKKKIKVFIDENNSGLVSADNANSFFETFFLEFCFQNYVKNLSDSIFYNNGEEEEKNPQISDSESDDIDNEIYINKPKKIKDKIFEIKLKVIKTKFEENFKLYEEIILKKRKKNYIFGRKFDGDKEKEKYFFNKKDSFVSRTQFSIAFLNNSFWLTDCSQTNLTGILVEKKAYQIFEGLLLSFGKSSIFHIKELQFSYDNMKNQIKKDNKFKQFKLKTGTTTLSRYIKKKKEKDLKKMLPPNREIAKNDYIILEGISGSFKGISHKLEAEYQEDDSITYMQFNVGSDNSNDVILKKKVNYPDDFIDEFHIKFCHDQRMGWLIARNFYTKSQISEKAETFIYLKSKEEYLNNTYQSNPLELEKDNIICADDNFFKVMGESDDEIDLLYDNIKKK